MVRFHRGPLDLLQPKNVKEDCGRMAELADATALGAVGATLGGSNPLPPIRSDGKLRDPAPQSSASEF